MSDEAAFLRDVVDHPDDDAPRLVFADWLEERGDSRGEFIRVQCDLAKLGPTDERRPDLEERSAELLAMHGDVWGQTAAKFGSDPTFRRGFVEEISVGAKKFLTDGGKLLGLVPVRKVRLTRLGSSSVDAKSLAGCPFLESLRGLELSGRLGEIGIHPILTSPRLKQLRSLTLATSDPCRFDWLDRVVAQGALPHLEELTLSGPGWQTGIARRLADPKLPFRLRKLTLASDPAQNPYLGPGDAAVLAGTANLAALTHLDLAYNVFRVEGAQALAASTHLQHLESFSVHGCQIGLAGLQAIVQSTIAVGLVSLDARHDNLTDKAVLAIVASGRLKKLAELQLGMNHVGPAGARALATWPGLARLRVLHFFSDHELGDDGAAALAASSHVENLWTLDLGYTDVTNVGVTAIARSPHFGQLRRLNLAGNKTVDDAGIKALAQAQRLPQLRHLDLSYAAIGDPSAQALAETKALPRLRTVRAAGTRIKSAGKKALVHRLGASACYFG